MAFAYIIYLHCYVRCHRYVWKNIPSSLTPLLTLTSRLIIYWSVMYHWPVDCTHKGPVTQKMFPFDDAIIGGFPSQRPATGALMFSLICAWTNDRGYNLDVGNLGRNRGLWRHCQAYSIKAVMNLLCLQLFVYTRALIWSEYVILSV